jgi:hypothetical protein
MTKYKYYKWIFKYWFYEKFSGTFMERLYFIFKGKVLSLPSGHFPMKYNPISEAFDQFYTWNEMLLVDKTFRKTT